MHFHIFESGSKGNCTLVCSNGHYIIIDDGISNRKLVKKLMDVNVDINSIGAVLVTHNHSDHIAGLSSFSKEIIHSTVISGVDTLVANYLIPFEEYEINGFKITVLPTSHDAPGSIGFIIEADNEKLVYITDTGYIYGKVIEYIANADYYVIESNHNVRMLMETKRTQYLKKRILGDFGHLSNVDSAHYICDVIGDKTKQIILAHLSEEANSQAKAIEDYRLVFDERDVDFDLYDIRCASQTDTVSGGNLGGNNNG